MRDMRVGAALFFVLFFAMPFFARAQVVINEIMYNPQGSDTGREWIELYNQGGTDVTMVGGSGNGSWRISDSSKHTLTDPSGGIGRGSLIIPAGGYLVITSDPSTFVGEFTDGSYSVIKASISLNNTGLTISLVDGAGITVDSVTYGKDQGGNDDGTSLQRTANGAWLTALPTPGTANANTAYIASSDTTSNSSSSTTTTTAQQTTTATGPAPTSSYVPPPAPSLYADAGGNRTVIVGADVEFDGRAYDKNQHPLDNSTTRFSWNFGDGSTAEGPSVLHHFDYPGRYAVVFSIAQDVFAVSDTLTVTAESASLSFSALPDGGVSIENRASHDLDLSGWIIKESAALFAAQFVLPTHSSVLAGQTMHVGSGVLKFKAGPSALFLYPNGVRALSAGEVSVQTAPTTALPPPALSSKNVSPESHASAVVDTDHVPQQDASATEIAQDSASAPPVSSSDVATSTQTASAAQPGFSLSAGKLWWWVGALLLALIGAVALVLSRGMMKREWDIIEQKD